MDSTGRRINITSLSLIATCVLCGPAADSQELHREIAPGFYRYSGGCLASSVAFQADGRLVAAGWVGEPGRQRMIVVRFNQDHTVDTGFGARSGSRRRGWTEIEVGEDARALDVEIDPENGRILLAGWARSDGDNHLALVRLETDGDVDRTFRNSGVVLHQFESQINEGFGFKTQTTYGTAVALDLHGNIIVAGRTGALGDHEPFASKFSRDGVHQWSRKHGTSGFDDGANAVVVQMKPEPYFIYTTGFSVITNVLRRFNHDGSVHVGQSSLGFGYQTWGLSYDDSTGRLVTAATGGRDMVIRALDERPEVIAGINYPNPFKKDRIDSVARALGHLASGRLAVAGHGRSYDAKDNSGRRFLFALYDPDASLVAHDRPDFGGRAAAAYDLATHGRSRIALAGRVFVTETSPDSARFEMGFVLYDGSGRRLGEPWTFRPDRPAESAGDTR